MQMQHEHGWTIGARVFVVYSPSFGVREHPRYMMITKIGRRWITIKNGHREHRFDAETLRLDGGQFSSPGDVYASEEEYLSSLEVNKAWANFTRRLAHTPPDHITMADIEAMTRMVWPEEKK